MAISFISVWTFSRNMSKFWQRSYFDFIWLVFIVLYFRTVLLNITIFWIFVYIVIIEIWSVYLKKELCLFTLMVKMLAIGISNIFTNTATSNPRPIKANWCKCYLCHSHKNSNIFHTGLELWYFSGWAWARMSLSKTVINWA